VAPSTQVGELECVSISKTYGRTQVLAPTTITFGAGARDPPGGADPAGHDPVRRHAYDRDGAVSRP